MKSLMVLLMLVMGTSSALAYTTTQCFQMGLDKQIRKDQLAEDKLNVRLSRDPVQYARIQSNQNAIQRIDSICGQNKALKDCLYKGTTTHLIHLQILNLQSNVHLNSGLQVKINKLIQQNISRAQSCKYDHRFIY